LACNQLDKRKLSFAANLFQMQSTGQSEHQTTKNADT